MPGLIIVGYVWQILGRGDLFASPAHPWAAPKMLTLNRVKVFFTVLCKRIWHLCKIRLNWKEEITNNKEVLKGQLSSKCALIEGVHLTLSPHIFSVQVKSGASYITGQWFASSEWNKRNLILTLTLNLNYLLLFFIIKFVSLSWFLRLYYFYGLSFYEEVMSVRLYVFSNNLQ